MTIYNLSLDNYYVSLSEKSRNPGIDVQYRLEKEESYPFMARFRPVATICKYLGTLPLKNLDKCSHEITFSWLSINSFMIILFHSTVFTIEFYATMKHLQKFLLLVKFLMFSISWIMVVVTFFQSNSLVSLISLVEKMELKIKSMKLITPDTNRSCKKLCLTFFLWCLAQFLSCFIKYPRHGIAYSILTGVTTGLRNISATSRSLLYIFFVREITFMFRILEVNLSKVLTVLDESFLDEIKQLYGRLCRSVETLERCFSIIIVLQSFSFGYYISVCITFLMNLDASSAEFFYRYFAIVGNSLDLMAVVYCSHRLTKQVSS